MTPRLPKISLTSILLTVLVLIQFPLWFGEGGWIRVWRMEQQIEAKARQNEAQRQQILSLEAEVRDFKRSPRAAEERARFELGMIQPGERFVQWVPAATGGSVSPAKPADPGR